MAYNPYDKYGLLIPRWYRLSYAPDIVGESMRRLKVECEADQQRYDRELAEVKGAIERGERADVAGELWFTYHPEEEYDEDGPYMPTALSARLKGMTVEEYITWRDRPEPPYVDPRTDEEVQADLELEWSLAEEGVL